MKLKIIVYLLVILSAFGAISCIDRYDEDYEEYLKEQEELHQKIYAQFVVDSTLIESYLEANDSVAEFDVAYGIFYNIHEQGSDNHPSLGSIVKLAYSGSLLDGTVFDATPTDSTVQFFLGNLISGLQVGLQKIGSGGKISLYLPSVYGYGTQAKETIPANSVLIFNVDLISVF